MSNRFESGNYIHIPGFAITDMELKGSELLCWSLIYGFSQDGDGEFKGSLAYLSSALNITIPNAKAVLDRLLEKGLLTKDVVITNKGKECHYRAVLLKQENGIIETIKGGIIETINNNKEVDIKKDIKKVKYRGTTENLCLFVDSKYNDWEMFSKEFEKPEFAGIDIAYYFGAVADWSSQKGKKMRDWIATARNFIRKDMEQKKVHRLQSADVQGMFDYINSLQ